MPTARFCNFPHDFTFSTRYPTCSLLDEKPIVVAFTTNQIGHYLFGRAGTLNLESTLNWWTMVRWDRSRLHWYAVFKLNGLVLDNYIAETFLWKSSMKWSPTLTLENKKVCPFKGSEAWTNPVKLVVPSSCASTSPTLLTVATVWLATSNRVAACGLGPPVLRTLN